MCRFGRWLGDVVVLGQTRPVFELLVMYSLWTMMRVWEMRTYETSFA